MLLWLILVFGGLLIISAKTRIIYISRLCRGAERWVRCDFSHGRTSDPYQHRKWGIATPRPRSGIGQAGRLSLRAALLSARERRFEHGCLWTGQENGSGVLYFILTWSKARGQHRLGAVLLRFPMICGRRILFLIRRFYREINGKGTGTNEKR